MTTPRFFALIAALPAAIILILHLFSIPQSVGFLRELPTMVSLTAACILCLAISIVVIEAVPSIDSSARVALKFLLPSFALIASIAVIIGIYIPALVSSRSLADQFFGKEPPFYLMSIQTCIAVVLASLSQMLVIRKSKESSKLDLILFQGSTATVLAFCGLIALGYIYSIVGVYGITNRLGMSALTAFSIGSVALGTMLLIPSFGIVRIIRQKSPVGFFFRTFVLTGVILPFFLAGFLRWAEVRHGLDSSYGMAALVFITAISMMALGLKTALTLEKIETQNDEIRLNRLEIAESNEASRLRERFLANMSHEIRTPLTAVMGYLDYLDDENLKPADRIAYTTQAKRNSKTLLRVLDDILDLSKLNEHRLKVRASKFSLNELIEDVTSQFFLEAERKSVNIQITHRQHETILADFNRLQQILTNLVSNAVKFTASGYVSVSARFIDKFEFGGKTDLIIEIQDTGSGIPKEAHAQLFQAFYQVDDSVTRKYGGSGIGLALSARLAKLMGGKLTLKGSTPNVGSTFELRIPVTVETSQVEVIPSAPSSPIEQRFDGLKFLLVEDNPDNRFLVKRYLEKLGAIVEDAENGQLGLEKALNAHYAIIIMDIQMPVMGGLEATRLLRQRGYHGPIIALSAHASHEHMERSIDAGFNAHATKPLEKPIFNQQLAKLLEA